MPPRSISHTHGRRPASLFRPAAVRRREVGRRSVVSFSGELDLATAPRLQQAIAAAADQGAAQVWVDLLETTFMDSAGIHTLLRAQRSLAQLNRGMAVICADGPVRRVLAISGADALIPTHADPGAAHRAA